MKDRYLQFFSGEIGRLHGDDREKLAECNSIESFHDVLAPYTVSPIPVPMRRNCKFLSRDMEKIGKRDLFHSVLSFILY